MDKATFLQKAATAGFRREPVEVEGFGTVHVREVSAAEAKEYAALEQKPDADHLHNAAWLATRVLCDEQGRRMLEDDDVGTVKQIPLRVLKAIADTAGRLSGFAEDAKKNGSAS